MYSLLTTILAASAFFHAALKTASPAQNAIVAAAPTKVTLTFTEGVNVAVSGIAILRMDSSLVEKLVVTGTGDPTAFAGPITKALPAGKYIVRWKTAAADDGHANHGAYSFTVKPSK